jgi:Na+-transporting methylmalonyl-CoA/oxaloacetate decarboxylase gamma subunit
MTADQRFTLIIAGLGLVFTVMVAILGMIIGVVRKFTQSEDRLNELVETTRQDRIATNRRLRWLEENLWKGTNAR